MPLYLGSKEISGSIEYETKINELINEVKELSAGIRKHADYIIEQIIGSPWSYRKWESGLAECWGKVQLTNLNITVAATNQYYSQKPAQIELPPNLFNSIQDISITATNDLTKSSSTFAYRASVIDNSTIGIDIRCFASFESAVSSVFIHVYGLWK